MTAQTTGPAAPQEARPRDQRKLLTDLDPSVVLSVLTGVVAVFGLLNQVIFYRFFDISYVAYIGTGDFLALVLQTIPFTLLVVLVLLAASALTVIGLIYSGAGLLSWFWKLVVALSKLCRLALVRLCGLFAATAAWLLRQDGQGAMARASGQRDLVAAIAQAAQKLSRLCLSYEPVCAQRSASGREKQEKVAQAKRASLQWWLAFANRRYFELFLVHLQHLGSDQVSRSERVRRETGRE
jgi:hypothetical protein